MLFRIAWFGFVVLVLISPACTVAADNEYRQVPAGSEPPATPEPQPTKFVVPAEFLNATPEQLCNRLSEIKVLPHKDPNDTDPIYEALIAKGPNAYPCLLEKITDRTRMPDPRQAPIWQHYAVGDTAVFILVRSIGGENDRLREELLKEMLPPRYREEWTTNGVYAYFNYVSKSKNRSALQSWWKNWLNENKG